MLENAWFPTRYRKQLQQISENLIPKIPALREAIEIALEVLPTEFPQLSKDNRIAYFMQVLARIEKNIETKGMISIQDIYELEILKYELKWIVQTLLNKENQVKTAEFMNWFIINESNPLFILVKTENAGVKECIPMFPIEAMCWKEDGEIFWEEIHLDKLIFYKMIPAQGSVNMFEFSYDTIDWIPCHDYEERSSLQDEYKTHLKKQQEQSILLNEKKNMEIMNDKHYSVKHAHAKENVTN